MKTLHCYVRPFELYEKGQQPLMLGYRNCQKQMV